METHNNENICSFKTVIDKHTYQWKKSMFKLLAYKHIRGIKWCAII